MSPGSSLGSQSLGGLSRLKMECLRSQRQEHIGKQQYEPISVLILLIEHEYQRIATRKCPVLGGEKVGIATLFGAEVSRTSVSRLTSSWSERPGSWETVHMASQKKAQLESSSGCTFVRSTVQNLQREKVMICNCRNWWWLWSMMTFYCSECIEMPIFSLEMIIPCWFHHLPRCQDQRDWNAPCAGLKRHGCVWNHHPT